MTLTFGADQLCHRCRGQRCAACNNTGLEPRAHARASDPPTSVAAAKSISAERLRWSQDYILNLLRHYGPMTDVRLVDLVRTVDGHPVMSDSGARSRRAELVEARRVRDTGRRERLKSGRFATVWEASEDAA